MVVLGYFLDLPRQGQGKATTTTTATSTKKREPILQDTKSKKKKKDKGLKDVFAHKQPLLITRHSLDYFKKVIQLKKCRQKFLPDLLQLQPLLCRLSFCAGFLPIFGRKALGFLSKHCLMDRCLSSSYSRLLWQLVQLQSAQNSPTAKQSQYS